MDAKEQIQSFADDVQKLCDRYADEYDLSSAAVCGVLLMQIRIIQDTAIGRHEDGES